jgi:hypothetical protein
VSRVGFSDTSVLAGAELISQGAIRSGVALRPIQTPHIAITFPPEDIERDLEQLEEDEETMRRANAEVQQMQKRMLEGTPSTCHPLPLPSMSPSSLARLTPVPPPHSTHPSFSIHVTQPRPRRDSHLPLLRHRATTLSLPPHLLRTRNAIVPARRYGFGPRPDREQSPEGGRTLGSVQSEGKRYREHRVDCLACDFARHSHRVV